MQSPLNQDTQLEYYKTRSGYYGYRPTHCLFPKFPVTVKQKSVHHLCNYATSQIIQ